MSPPLAWKWSVIRRPPWISSGSTWAMARWRCQNPLATLTAPVVLTTPTPPLATSPRNTMRTPGWTWVAVGQPPWLSPGSILAMPIRAAASSTTPWSAPWSPSMTRTATWPPSWAAAITHSRAARSPSAGTPRTRASQTSPSCSSAQAKLTSSPSPAAPVPPRRQPITHRQICRALPLLTWTSRASTTKWRLRGRRASRVRPPVSLAAPPPSGAVSPSASHIPRC
mmetsp:Transcript_33249/g.73538  ORF Transcript_33249/g.73538 Transcript_33249/m.73538 type:complete len:225 (-) Transcript_33249:1250-1924(-)